MGKKDFSKPKLERFGTESRDWLPSLVKVSGEEDREGHRLVAQLEVLDAKAFELGLAAFPQKMYLELILPRREPVIQVAGICMPLAPASVTRRALKHSLLKPSARPCLP